jgi:hypothetical protein
MYDSLSNPTTTSGRNLVASVQLRKTISYAGKCEYELQLSIDHVWIALKKGCAI